VSRNRRIVGVVKILPPRIEVEVGKLCLPVLLHSGSERSLISFGHYRQLMLVDPNLQLLTTDLTCVKVSGQNLDIVGKVKVALRIYGFSWSWVFLVSRRLRVQPIVGVDFISTTKTVLELGSSRCYLAFAPLVYIKFIGVIAICLVVRLCQFLPSHPKCNLGNIHLFSEEIWNK
jgi:hypothetical protein